MQPRGLEPSPEPPLPLTKHLTKPRRTGEDISFVATFTSHPPGSLPGRRLCQHRGVSDGRGRAGVWGLPLCTGSRGP